MSITVTFTAAQEREIRNELIAADITRIAGKTPRYAASWGLWEMVAPYVGAPCRDRIFAAIEKWEAR
jgi:hypothetical protein